MLDAADRQAVAHREARLARADDDGCDTPHLYLP
jgi:hypothetical protein